MPSKDDSSAQPVPIAYAVKTAVMVSGLPRTTLFEAMRDGSLRSIKKGRRRLILRDDLVAWLKPADGAAS
jgi:excisionase family DNA binding protein